MRKVRIFLSLMIFLNVVFFCKKTKKTIEFNQELANELKKMVKIDQLAASYAFPPKEFAHYSQKKWLQFKDSIYKTHQKRIAEIFNKNGFPGYNLLGKEGSQNFWIMVQHSDHNPEFQNKVLQKMKLQVDKKNANSKNYAMLVDRVKINTGLQQIYGSQVSFNHKKAQAYPKNLFDSINVNKRRRSIGLQPLEIYLNSVSKTHFEMNKKVYLKAGIKEPKLYPINN